MKYIFNPFSGFLDAISNGGGGGDDPVVSNKARQVIDQVGVVVAEGLDAELKIYNRIVFQTANGVRIGNEAGEGIIGPEIDTNISIGDQAGYNPSSS